jgi:hypothetical protein
MTDEELAAIRERLGEQKRFHDTTGRWMSGLHLDYVEDGGALLAEVDRLRAENAFLLHAIDDDHAEAMHRDAEVAAMRVGLDDVIAIIHSARDMSRPDRFSERVDNELLRAVNRARALLAKEE